jgi:hypothetical protein
MTRSRNRLRITQTAVTFWAAILNDEEELADIGGIPKSREAANRRN